MKKVLLILAAFGFCFTAQAQSFEIIEPTSDDELNMPTNNFNNGAHALFANVSANDLVVSCEMIAEDVADNHIFQFCWAGTCWAYGQITSPDNEAIAADDTTNGFTLYVNPQNSLGTTVLRALWKNTADANDTASHTFTFTFTQATSVGEFAVLQGFMLGNAYPNPANQSVKFPMSLTGATQVTLSVVDLQGRTVLTQPVAAGSAVAEVVVSPLAPGVYTARLQNAEGQLSAQRFVVAH